MDPMPRAMLRPMTFVLLAACLRAPAVPAADALQDGFLTPPDTSRPFVFWFRLDGNITREGITAERPEEGIRHYSGPAAYRMALDPPIPPDGRRLFLDLGRVKDLCEVRLNGRSLGAVWCAPWRIEITDAIRPGSNDLEVVVANEWVNRLIGDAGRPPGERLTWTTWNPYKPDSPLLESGLLGPVKVVWEHGR
jgi:hypothetical protein